MGAISEYIRNDHNRCDLLCNEAAVCVSTEAWDRAEVIFLQFRNALEQHFTMEEDVLFSAFEKAIRSPEYPTSAMRNEHQKIRSVIFMLQDALTRRARNAFLGHADTLDIMMHQHNQVEENILYPMIDHVLGAQKHDIIKAMTQIATQQSSSCAK